MSKRHKNHYYKFTVLIYYHIDAISFFLHYNRNEQMKYMQCSIINENQKKMKYKDKELELFTHQIRSKDKQLYKT